MKKRQDILSTLLWELIWPVKDRLVMEIGLNLPSNPQIVMAVLRRRDANNQIPNYEDLSSLGKEFKRKKLSKSLMILGEHEEHVNHLMNDAVIQCFNKYERFINAIHISDQNNFSNE